MGERRALIEVINEKDGRIFVPPLKVVVHIGRIVSTGHINIPCCGTQARLTYSAGYQNMVVCADCLDEIRSMG